MVSIECRNNELTRHEGEHMGEQQRKSPPEASDASAPRHETFAEVHRHMLMKHKVSEKFILEDGASPSLRGLLERRHRQSALKKQFGVWVSGKVPDNLMADVRAELMSWGVQHDRASET